MVKELEAFEILQHPIWVKSNHKVIFVNSSFKKVFDIEESCTEKDIIDFLSIKNEHSELLKSICNEDKYGTSFSFSYKKKTYKYTISTYYKNDLKMLIGTIIEDYCTENENLMLRTVIDNIPSMIFYKNRDLKYMGINKACENFYNEKGVKEIIGKNDLEFPMEEGFKELCYKHDNIVLKTKEPLYIEEKVFNPKDNYYKTFQTIKTPVINDEDEVIGLVGVVRDITEYKLTEERLTYLSYVDPLTSLYNRFYFDKKIDLLVKEEKYPIGIIFGDVNGLKLVNDAFGHLEGDDFLKKVANCLQECCDDSVIPFRFGGDEFCIVVPQASKDKCMYYINKINKYCSTQTYKNIEIKISLGFSLLKENGSINEILSEAESEVYKQKMLDSKSIRISTLNNLKEELNKKNIETEEHTERVVTLCERLGKELNLPVEVLDKLILVAGLHDIGKIAIPDEILLKPGPLSRSEFEIMKTHSEKGYRFALLLPELSHVARGILTHHERWDGSGYPLGLKGEDIPLIARIVSVVDSYDAMTNHRVYSKAKSKEEAIKELQNSAGTQFDPEIVHAFCKITK